MMPTLLVSSTCNYTIVCNDLGRSNFFTDHQSLAAGAVGNSSDWIYGDCVHRPAPIEPEVKEFKKFNVYYLSAHYQTIWLLVTIYYWNL